MAAAKESKTEGVYVLDGKDIPYVVYRKAVKNLNLRVHTDGTLYISVPKRAAKDAHLAFLFRHEDFLRRSLAKISQRNKNTLPLAADGCPADGVEFRIYGIKYRICRHRAEDTPFPPFRSWAELREHPADDGFVWDVYLKKGIDETVAAGAVARVVYSKAVAVLEGKIQALMPSLQRRFEMVLPMISDGNPTKFPYSRFIFSPKEIRIKQMTSRWGSCAASRGVVTFNLRLLCAPEICTQYVMYHEFAHFLVQDHSAAFHALMSLLMPEYRSVRAILNGRENN